VGIQGAPLDWFDRIPVLRPRKVQGVLFHPRLKALVRKDWFRHTENEKGLVNKRYIQLIFYEGKLTSSSSIQL
jgi:hypothetical protein